MCAITGLVNLNKEIIDLELLKRMNNLAAHRGPDGDDYFCYDNVGLGHRRLAIFDISPLGSQPMHYLHLSIIFNGAIYNFLEIKDELLQHQYTFETTTDTEVILKAFHCWGTNCFNKFNGMWALAIYNQQTHEIIGCRDRLGVKPMYFCQTNTFFGFGSEIKQLLAIQQAKVNWPILMDYLVYNLESHTDNTFFDNIKLLPAAHYFIFNTQLSNFRIYNYFDWTTVPARDNETELENAFEQLFHSSIQLRLRADVPLATCLSGGIDSSAITQIANTVNTQKYAAFTAVSSDERNSDEKYAEQVVKQINLKWLTNKPSFKDFKNDIENLIYCQEEPFYSTSNYMQYSLMKFVSSMNIKVLLDGQGADEILLGYTKYLSVPYASLFGINFWKALPAMARHNSKSKLSLLTEAIVLRNFYIRNVRLRYKFRHLKQTYFNLANAAWAKELAYAYKHTTHLQLLEIKHTQLPKLLKYADKNAMYFGVESRLPFLDYRLVNFCLQLPVSLKINQGWTKYILRKTQTSLPKAIAWRKNKIGFEAPESEWLSNQWMQEEINQSSIIREIFNQIPTKPDKHLMWKLFNIALWQKKYNVSL